MGVARLSGEAASTPNGLRLKGGTVDMKHNGPRLVFALRVAAMRVAGYLGWMSKALRTPIVLAVAGLVATVSSQLGPAGKLALFGASDAIAGPFGLGPEWIARVPDVAGGLGLSAALYGVISWRWRDRAVAVIVAVLLALGAGFVLYWLVAPPSAVIDSDGDPYAYTSWMWVAAAALAISSAAATAVARES
jgi:hypothetical protein